MLRTGCRSTTATWPPSAGPLVWFGESGAGAVRSAAKTWTEESAAFSARCLLTNRAGAECCRQVGRNARPITQMAHELGVCWDTVMDAVREHGEPLVDDPQRVGVARGR